MAVHAFTGTIDAPARGGERHVCFGDTAQTLTSPAQT
jgi:hypothetical protein